MGTESEFEKKRSQLSAAKQALLEKRLRGEGRRQTPRPGIPRRTVQGSVPLSFSQRRLWFLDRLEPGSPAYNVPIAWRLSGPLALEPLKRAIHEIRCRHEILRTAYVLEGSEPKQIVLEPQEAGIELADLSSLSPRLVVEGLNSPTN